MKKLALILAVLMLGALASCGTSKVNTGTGTSTDTVNEKSEPTTDLDATNEGMDTTVVETPTETDNVITSFGDSTESTGTTTIESTGTTTIEITTPDR